MRPIYSYLINRKPTTSFKVPGHKTRVDFSNTALIDETETFNTDNLHMPEGIIKEALAFARELYKTYETLYMVNGSTGALHTAILSSTLPGEEVLVQRNSHMSIYHAMILGRLRPRYLYPEIKGGVIGGLCPHRFEEELRNFKGRLIVLTNPSYEGYSSDLARLIDLAHSQAKLVIVDEAHGAHLPFTDRLIDSALDLGADMVVHSAHKTLPSLTQTALLHINSPRVDLSRVKMFSKILQTSSPSYVFMASLEGAIDYMAKEGRFRLDELVSFCQDFDRYLDQVPGIVRPKPNIYTKDISKLHFGLRGYRGSDLAKILYEDYSISMEYSDYNHVVGVGSVMNDKNDFDRLKLALKDLAKKDRDLKDGLQFSVPNPKIVMGLEEAFNKFKIARPYQESLGHISGAFVVAYPPGQVILAPGEEVQEDHINLIKTYKENKIQVLEADMLQLVDKEL